VFGKPNTITGQIVCANVTLTGQEDPRAFARRLKKFCCERLAAFKVLFKDLAACNAYGDGLAAAAKVAVPATLVLGERDLMTPAAGGRQLAAALPKARVVTLKDAGHMLLSERPDDVLAAVRNFAA